MWFISVFSINIFLEMYGQNRSDYCWAGPHGTFFCGTQPPWTAEVFNAVPWILTGVFIFVVLYFSVRKFLIGPMGSRLTPILGRQVAVGSVVATVLLCTVTWPVYENGFWNQRGLGTMGFWEYQYDAKLEELDGIRGQPADTLIHVDKGPVWEDWEDECLAYEQTSSLSVWETMEEGTTHSEWCVLPAKHFVNWGIYQPTRSQIVDFSGVNGHADTQTSRNIGANEIIYQGADDGSPISISESIQFEVEDLGISKVQTDIGCNFRTTVRNAGDHSQSLTLTDDSGQEIWSNSGSTCESGNNVPRFWEIIHDFLHHPIRAG